MKQKEMKMVAYVAPDVSIYEIHSEGALCGSVDGDFNPNDLTNGRSGWFEYEEE